VWTALRNVHVGRHARADWTKIPKPKGVRFGGNPRPLSVGFYVSWDSESLESLRDHINQMDVVSPQWIGLHGSNGQVDIVTDPVADDIIRKAAHPAAVLPLVHNSHDQIYDGPLADKFLADPRARAVLIATLKDVAEKRGFAGYVFDFENMSPASVAAYPGFIAEVKAALKPEGREVWVTASFDDTDWPLK
jgi:spore germination protein YaaH